VDCIAVDGAVAIARLWANWLTDGIIGANSVILITLRGAHRPAADIIGV